MSIFHKFNRGDQLFYRLDMSPCVELASGSGGWRSSVGTSGSIGMYGDYRDRTVSMVGDGMTIGVRVPLDHHTMKGATYVSSSYPMTGSVSFVKVRNSDGTPWSNDWYDEHFQPIMNLYDYYSAYDPDYTTASYDFYCLFSVPSSKNRVTISEYTKYESMTSSYTVEAMIKPFSVTGSNDYTIAERVKVWKFYITGSESKLVFSASDGSQAPYTSSMKVSRDVWQHVVFEAGAGSGAFFVNLVDAGTMSVTGNLYVGSTESLVSIFKTYANSVGGEFHGFMQDIRFWSVKRTWAQLSSSHNGTLYDSGSSDLKLYFRFNDGPFGITHGKTKGSGAFDYSASPRHGILSSFNNRSAPVWHPCDNQNFVTKKSLCTGSVNMLKVLHLPSMYYGRSIATGSVRLTCNAFLSCSLVRTLVDDGRGGLYLSGSACSSSLSDKNDYYGVRWPKIGNVFYDEGLVVIKDPALLDFAEDFILSSSMPSDLLQVSYNGQTTKPVRMIMCRSNVAEDNCSRNKTFSKRDSNDKLRVIRDDQTTYITAVGIYNEEHRLVAVAKIAQPIRKRERDKINVRVKLDF